MAGKSKARKIRKEFRRGFLAATAKVRTEQYPIWPSGAWKVGFREGLNKVARLAIRTNVREGKAA